MKDRMIRLFGKLLGLLGFAAVGVSCDEGMRVEYGTTYTIDLQRIADPDPEENWCTGIYGAEVTLELERVE